LAQTEEIGLQRDEPSPCFYLVAIASCLFAGVLFAGASRETTANYAVTALAPVTQITPLGAGSPFRKYPGV
jgi:hypothetical protein